MPVAPKSPNMVQPRPCSYGQGGAVAGERFGRDQGGALRGSVQRTPVLIRRCQGSRWRTSASGACGPLALHRAAERERDEEPS